MTDAIPATWFDQVPKVELHLHLEGAIPLDTLWTLIEKYGGDPLVPTIDALRERFTYRDFPHFLELWRWKNGFLREYDDFGLIAEAFARSLEAQNIRYAEAFLSAPDHGQLDPQRLLESVRQGLDLVPGVDISLIVDLVRDKGPAMGMRTLEQAGELANLGVIGIGIGGGEHDHPPEPFAPVYERARQMGLHTTAHAGEAAGAESVWGAIRALRVERIGHGTRADEDPALIAFLAESQLPIEMCPLSNVRTGVTASIDVHPIRHYVEQGLLVTVNTDDPAMFGNSLAEEYETLHRVHGFATDDIRRLILNAVDACWLDNQGKAALRQSIVDHPGWA